MFPEVKEYVVSDRFKTDNDVEAAVKLWFEKQNTDLEHHEDL
jgi:hypothetical protein